MLHFGGFFEVLELSAEMSMYTLVRGEHSKSQQSQNSLLWVRLKVEELGHLRVDENKSFLSYSRRHTAPRSITHTLLLVHSSFQHGPVDGQLSVASPIVGWQDQEQEGCSKHLSPMSHRPFNSRHCVKTFSITQSTVKCIERQQASIRLVMLLSVADLNASHITLGNTYQ